MNSGTVVSTAASACYWRVFLKWTLLVTLNAICSFIAALLTEHNSRADILAMVFGIITFICGYAVLELWALSRGIDQFIKSLKTGVVVKMILQLIPGVEVGAGWIAHDFVELFGLKRGFFRTYIMTDVVGIVLSMVVFLISTVILYVRHLVSLRKRRGTV